MFPPSVRAVQVRVVLGGLAVAHLLDQPIAAGPSWGEYAYGQAVRDVSLVSGLDF